MQSLFFRLSVLCLVVSLFSPVSPATLAAPATDHPRLWVRSSDLPRLRSWAVDSNPIYHDGLAVLAARARQNMDEGAVPAKDTGGTSYEDYPTEMYAQLFAFMSLVESEPAQQANDAKRARTLLIPAG